MKISILVCNLSHNCIVRTYPIAKVLERHYEVDVAGFVFGNVIFEPYRNEFQYSPYYVESGKKVSRMADAVRGVREIVKSVEKSDIIYAFKPRLTSFGIGLLAKYVNNLPLILDIEDWEAALYHSSSVAERLSLKYDNPLCDAAMEPLTRFADEITVVSSFLQQRYGGVKLPHGADCSYFDPGKYHPEDCRKMWGFDRDKLILFTGIPWPHKGLEETLKALKLIDTHSVRLVIVGPETDYVERLRELGGDLGVCVGAQPHSRMPEFLSLADLVVLPQRDTDFARAQVPGKVFEAMAMGKAIIATTVSDLPEILEGCGWTVEPENPQQLAEAIQYVLDHPSDAQETGHRARQKCIEKYSWDAMEKILIPIFSKYQ